ncbi:MAG TPA: J domain-containing protein [Micropepsaceae bacterium]|nr:J domain-containing protein [Micropepsaceae bacterium]
MNNNSRTLQKTAVMVEISLNDGSRLVGKLFVSPQGRLSDVLNDDRQFLPVEGTDGTMFVLAKSAIKQVTLPVAEIAAYRGSNPYLILGVQEGATLDELKKAYHHLCMANHPDRIKGLGLTSEFQELATKNMARINNAYAQALKALNG